MLLAPGWIILFAIISISQTPDRNRASRTAPTPHRPDAVTPQDAVYAVCFSAASQRTLIPAALIILCALSLPTTTCISLLHVRSRRALLSRVSPTTCLWCLRLASVYSINWFHTSIIINISSPVEPWRHRWENPSRTSGTWSWWSAFRPLCRLTVLNMDFVLARLNYITGHWGG